MRELKRGDTVTVEGQIYGATVVKVKPRAALVKYHDAREGTVKRWVAVEDLEPSATV